MKQFEYITYTIPFKNTLFSKKKEIDTDKITDDINLLGKKGWELVTEFTNQKNGFSQQSVLIFKREIVK